MKKIIAFLDRVKAEIVKYNTPQVRKAAVAGVVVGVALTLAVRG